MLIYGTYLANPAENLEASKWTAVVQAGVCLFRFFLFSHQKAGPKVPRIKSGTNQMDKKKSMDPMNLGKKKHSAYFVRCDEPVPIIVPKKWTKFLSRSCAVDLFFPKGFLTEKSPHPSEFKVTNGQAAGPFYKEIGPSYPLLWKRTRS